MVRSAVTENSRRGADDRGAGYIREGFIRDTTPEVYPVAFSNIKIFQNVTDRMVVNFMGSRHGLSALHNCIGNVRPACDKGVN